MKKYIFLFTVCFVSAILQAQIGINTETPQKLFHVDAQRNTLGSSNISDDVIVDATGNMGLGTLSPTAKLHIEAGSSTGMRIIDGTQSNNRILRSDTNGNTSWVDQPQSGGVIYNLIGSQINYPGEILSLVKAVQVTDTGNYLVIIRWWGSTSAVSGTNETSAYFNLYEGTDGTAGNPGAPKDAIEYYINSLPNAVFCFTTSLYANIQAGNWLKLYILPSVGGGVPFNWQIGVVSTTRIDWNPSIVIFRV